MFTYYYFLTLLFELKKHFFVRNCFLYRKQYYNTFGQLSRQILKTKIQS